MPLPRRHRHRSGSHGSSWQETPLALAISGFSSSLMCAISTPQTFDRWKMEVAGFLCWITEKSSPFACAPLMVVDEWTISGWSMQNSPGVSEILTGAMSSAACSTARVWGQSPWGSTMIFPLSGGAFAMGRCGNIWPSGFWRPVSPPDAIRLPRGSGSKADAAVASSVASIIVISALACFIVSSMSVSGLR